MRATRFFALALMGLASLPGRAQDRADLERRFEETMQGARLVGQFAVAGAAGQSLPQPDRYTVSRISRMDDGRWLFEASMSYGDQDIAIPMPFDVEWAGDTPVITLTEQTIPGIGTFTARVLIYDGFYAGTWKHEAFGGHLWGRIEPPDEVADAPAASPPGP